MQSISRGDARTLAGNRLATVKGGRRDPHVLHHDKRHLASGTSIDDALAKAADAGKRERAATAPGVRLATKRGLG